ncbi:thymidine phosphorylase [Leeia sp. TBRC 13508]|uniref:Thymidine phosphorylase n=1 Tax=Leeia speluncae TaxID=2884804 RepID=A0ABS8D3A7_9NEIS|nr:thymidine phosphorylase [Leeia speluncae]MCB6182664.1 thymidine phosphorylase [Leeia speluncae]
MTWQISEILREKREGKTLSADAIDTFVKGVASSFVSDSQIAAFTMATCIRGMTAEECVSLTLAMRDSGEVLDWSGLNLTGPVIDKHSTGGVGDLTSLLIGPMVAACGGFVPMISGRGLGHTGGTLDKLEAISGYCVTPEREQFQQVVKSVGVAIVGQTAALAPADRRIYAVRDVTATVESISLITASILSKKLAAGLDALVMDVKVGNGAFTPKFEDAVDLAQTIVNTGNGAGVKTSALITDMSQPLAPAAGNALEIAIALDYLTGRARPERLHRVTIALAAQLLVAGGLASSTMDAEQQLLNVLDSGEAFVRFERMCHALGATVEDLSVNDVLPKAPVIKPVLATEAGWVTRTQARQLGMVVVGLGGGRRVPADVVDPRVGLSQMKQVGEKVMAGEPLAWVHAANEVDAQQAVNAVSAAYTVSAQSDIEYTELIGPVVG